MEICDTLDYEQSFIFLREGKGSARAKIPSREGTRAEGARDIRDQYLSQYFSQYFNHFGSSLALAIPNKNNRLPVVQRLGERGFRYHLQNIISLLGY